MPDYCVKSSCEVDLAGDTDEYLGGEPLEIDLLGSGGNQVFRDKFYSQIILFDFAIIAYSIYLLFVYEFGVYCLVLSIIMTISNFAGSKYAISKGEEIICDDDALDVWSISHFFHYSYLMFVMNYWLGSAVFSLFIVGVISVLYEIIEVLITSTNPNFACESDKNKLVDLFVNLSGMLVSYLIIVFY